MRTNPPETYFCEEAPALSRAVLVILTLAYCAGVYLVGIGIAYVLEWLHALTIG